MRNLLMVLMICGAAGPALAEQLATDVGNTGRFEFDRLPHLVSPGWNLDNLEYPAEAITIESIGDDNRGLRIGRPDASQAGRYTITLRGSTHDWDPSEVGTTHFSDLYEGLFLGMFWMYREGTDAKIDTQLAVSRDGRRWRRVAERQTFLANAPEGSWDDGMSRAGRGINVVGDTIYLHYSMVNGPHRSPQFPKVERKFPGAIGLVTLRRDGFVSLNAGPDPGQLTTQPFTSPPGKLFLNVDARDGDVRVEVLDSKGAVLATSRPLAGDHRRVEIDGIADLGTVAGQSSIQLRITLRNAQLFSYWFE